MDVEGIQGGQKDIHQSIIDHRAENAQAHARILEEITEIGE
jgi:hypothetical protein